MSSKATITSVVGIAVAVLIGIYLFAYGLQPILSSITITYWSNGTIAQLLMLNLFTVLFYLGLALLPIAVLYRAIKGSGK